MKNYLLILAIVLCSQPSFCQDLRIYHGSGAESVFLKRHENAANSSRESLTITRGVDGMVTIHILNPNPFFYNYEIKTADTEIKDEYSDQFAELVKMINALPDLANPTSGPFGQRTVARLLPGNPAETTFDKYNAIILALDSEIKSAKSYILLSDNPETLDEALRRVGNSSGYGFRSAVASIKILSSEKSHFNSKTLEKDLDDALEVAISDGSFSTALGIAANAPLQSLYKAAFKGLNKQLTGTINEIVKVKNKETILRFQIPVKENKQTKVTLIITKINDADATSRELINEEVATVMPYYVRKTFEVVPVVNLVFQSSRKKYAVEDNIITSSPDDEARYNFGVMALMNFASFGESKKFGVGLGVGYSLQANGKENSLFVMPSLSYKSIVRIGFGFGYNYAPVGLNDGAEVGSPLPSNISNIEDVIDYKRRPAAVLSIAISGLTF